MRITSSGAAAIGACLITLGTGCSDDKKTRTSGSTTATTTETNGTSTTPASKDSTKTPEATLEKLWHQLQIGSVPTAVTVYDRRIRARLGSSTLIGALRVIAPQFAQEAPKIDKLTPTSPGVLVEVHRDLKKGKPLLSSYIVRKPKGRSGYVVAYDGLLANGIFVYVRDKEQRKINSASKRFSPRAIQRAKAVVAQYDALFAAK